MTQSISEELGKLIDTYEKEKVTITLGLINCEVTQEEHDSLCLQAKEKFEAAIQSKISQALTAERKKLREELIGRYTRIKSRLEEAPGSINAKMHGHIEIINDLLCYLDGASLLEEK